MLPDFRILRPTSLDDAVAALSQPGARALAGGTDLLPNLRRGLGEPAALVDLTAVGAFSDIRAEDGALRIGAGVTLETLAEHPAVPAVLAKAALAVAGPSHRAAATLGGNLCQDTRCVFYNQSAWWREANGWCLKYRGDLCHVVVKSDRCYATYHGDVAPALMVLDARAELAGPAGRRDMPLADLFAESGAAHLALMPGEVLAAVLVPPAEDWRADYAKVRIRDAIDFPLAGVAAALRLHGGRLTGLRVAITGAASAPLSVAVPGLEGCDDAQAAADAVAVAVRSRANVLKTTSVGPKYRRHVLQAAARRLILDLWPPSAFASHAD